MEQHPTDLYPYDLLYIDPYQVRGIAPERPQSAPGQYGAGTVTKVSMTMGSQISRSCRRRQRALK